jgi:hypothetical protein
MAISRGQLVKELEPGLNALFGLEYKRYENQHAEIYTTETSDRAFEEEVMLSGFANAAVKPEGSGVTFDNAQETYTARYTMETVALAFAITEEAIEDNLYDRLASRYTKALARSMANTKQIKSVNPLINGFGGGFTSGDGVQLFSTAHPTIAGTVSNTLATQADLNETSLEQSLMKSQGRTGTADNDINAIVSMGMVPQGYRVNNFLTDPNAYFFITDVPNGMKYFERTPIRTAMEGDFDTGNVRYKARERYRFGVSDYRGIFGSSGAS